MSGCLPGCIACRDLPPLFHDDAIRQAKESWSRIRAELVDPYSDLYRRRKLAQGEERDVC